MHVYAPEQPEMIPVSLSLHAADVKIHPPRFPAPETYFFKPLNETQLVYSKPFRIVQDVTIADTAATRARAQAAGRLTITGTLQYQACDDAICYAPVTVPVAWTLGLRPLER
jgi:DsbC/DsbD-like thiol-disulfide interchange protein